ncbi:MAG: hypothetical protein M3Q07_20185 [Pseudobdellovibrionaceae bacterium]|nr:hypothetical protein [Pseudobdellovibrionaceae bacterium]
MKNVLVGSMLLLLVACKTTQTAQTHAASVKPSALIGTAYDAHTQEFTGMSCLDLSPLGAEDYEMTSLSRLATEVSPGATEADLEALFGSFQKTFYAPATGLRLSRPYETVQRILEGEADAVKLIRVQSQTGLLRFRSATHSRLRLTADAQRLVQSILVAPAADRPSRIQAFVQTCGTGFLAGTRYSLGMAAVLRWVFRNADERRRWGDGLVARELDAWPDEDRAPGEARLRYESFLKETRDINARRLGDSGNHECSADFYQPCLDAARLFKNMSIPAYQNLVSKLAENPDLILPQAFLSEPEIISYRDIEPALIGVALEPTPQESEAWAQVRSRFVEAYIQTFQEVLQAERRAEIQSSKIQELHNRLQDISSLAQPCYRPLLNMGLCAQHAQRLPMSSPL